MALTVRDTGMGISASDLPHVFERFWRADRVRSRRVVSSDSSWALDRGGFGLGLSIAQWIVQAHGGSLTVQSRLGRGSMFTVVLPVASSGEDAPALERADNTPAAVASRDADARTDSNSDFTDS